MAFFAALFPQFIDTSSAILPQLIILGSTYIIVDGLILYAWAMVGIQVTKRVKMIQIPLINKVSGALMITAAGFLAIKDIELRAS